MKIHHFSLEVWNVCCIVGVTAMFCRRSYQHGYAPIPTLMSQSQLSSVSWDWVKVRGLVIDPSFQKTIIPFIVEIITKEFPIQHIVL